MRWDSAACCVCTHAEMELLWDNVDIKDWPEDFLVREMELMRSEVAAIARKARNEAMLVAVLVTWRRANENSHG
jgi:hypothetical protein